MTIRGVVQPVFDREDYDRIRDVVEGGSNWVKDFDEWQRRSDKQKQEAEAQGHNVVRIRVDPDEFDAWCEGKGKQRTSKTLQEHAVEKSLDQFKNQG